MCCGMRHSVAWCRSAKSGPGGPRKLRQSLSYRRNRGWSQDVSAALPGYWKDMRAQAHEFIDFWVESRVLAAEPSRVPYGTLRRANFLPKYLGNRSGDASGDLRFCRPVRGASILGTARNTNLRRFAQLRAVAGLPNDRSSIRPRSARRRREPASSTSKSDAAGATRVRTRTAS